MYIDRRFAGLIFTAALLLQPGARALSAPVEEHYAVAARHYATGEWVAAAAEFQAFAEQNPAHEQADDAWFFVCEALVQAENFEAASQQLSAFLQRAPRHRLVKQVLFRSGECLFLLGKNAEARAALAKFQQAYPQDPLNAFVLSYLGDIALEAQDIAAAGELFNRCLKAFPQSPAAIDSSFGLARVLEVQGQPAAARQRYELVAAQAGHELADDAQLQLGVMHFESQAFARAEQTLLAFRTTFAASEHCAQANYWLGMAQLRSGKSNDAAQTLVDAATEFAQSDEAPALTFSAAEALRQSGDLARADEYYQAVGEHFPQCDWADDAAVARALLAFHANDAERFAQSAAEFRAKFASSPLNRLLDQAVARQHLQAGRFAQAETILQRLVDAEQAERATGGSARSAARELIASDQADLRYARYYLALALSGQQKHDAAFQTLAAIIAPAGQDPALASAVRSAQGSALLALQRYGEAVPLLRAQLSTMTEVAERTKLRAQLVLALGETNQWQDADRELFTVFAEEGENPAAFAATQRLAERALSQGNLPLALKLFGLLARETTPAEYQAHGLAGLTAAQRKSGAREAARESLEQLIERYPTHPATLDALLVRAKSLEEAQEFDPALATYRKLAELHPATPQAPAALLAAARLHDKLQQDRQAAELLERLTQNYPQSAEFDGAMYTWAWVLGEMKEAAKSEALFRRIHDEFTQSKYWADATYRLAELAARSKQIEPAERLIGELIGANCDPSVLVNALYLRGQLHAAAGRWADVDSDMRQVVEQFPNHAVRFSADYWLAESAYRRGNLADAAERFENLEAAAAVRKETWLGMIPLRRVQLLVQEKEWARALEIATPIRQRFPGFAQQHEVDYLIGRCLNSQARFDDARAAFGRAIEAAAAKNTETAAMAQWMIGETYFHQQRHADAIAAYQKCAVEFPHPTWQAAALLQAGKCRQLQGDEKAAQRLYQKIVSDFAETPYAIEAGERLRDQQTRTAGRAARDATTTE